MNILEMYSSITTPTQKRIHENEKCASQHNVDDAISYKLLFFSFYSTFINDRSYFVYRMLLQYLIFVLYVFCKWKIIFFIVWPITIKVNLFFNMYQFLSKESYEFDFSLSNFQKLIFEAWCEIPPNSCSLYINSYFWWLRLCLERSIRGNKGNSSLEVF